MFDVFVQKTFIHVNAEVKFCVVPRNIHTPTAPPPQRRAKKIPGERDPKGSSFPGDGGWLFEVFFPGAPSKTGESSKTNSRSVEQAISYFPVNGLLKQELLFSSMIFLTVG